MTMVFWHGMVVASLPCAVCESFSLKTLDNPGFII